jgi:asparagine synthase (glutamine-hydrolysing)
MDAVRLRMISDVPLGAFLSGGVDSSAVVGIMSKLSTQPVKTFSICFDEAAFDETHYAQIVADYCKTDHVREVVRPDVVSILPKLIHQFDEPFADASMVPTYYVSQAARRHVTVALSGDGGDEVFGGYPWYRYGFRHERLQSMIPASLRPTVARMGRITPEFTRMRNYLSSVNKPVSYWGMAFPFFDPMQRGALYAGGVTEALSEYPGERVKIDALRHAEGLDALAQLQYNDLTVYMPGDILVKVDRASMLASLEVRAPLLDHVVFEFMARVPSRFKLNMNDSKILLKKAVGELLPPAIHNRPKQGFGMPVSSWLKGPLLPLMRETLLGKTARERDMFDSAYVSGMIEEHLRGEGNHYERLWGLLCFELWAQEYLDPA